jgi:membrane protein required for colicin V production
MELLTAFDYAVLGVLAVSVLLGTWRGVIGEILALAAWLVAIVAARAGGDPMAVLLEGVIAQPALRLIAAYALVVVGVLVLFAIGRRLLAMLVRAAGLGLLDRFLGAGFGILRGLVVVLVVVMLAGLTAVPAMAWWRGAVLAPPLETAVIAAKPWMPQELAKRIKYR